MSFVTDFIKAAAGICDTKQLADQLWYVDGNTVKVNISNVNELTKEFGSVRLSSSKLKFPILIIKNGKNDFRCYKNRCSHFGHRKLDAVPGENKIRCCSVHHSTYDLDGKNLSGPAKKPLHTYECELRDGVLTIQI